MKTEKIIKKLKGKIRKSKIYEHLKTFFYREEFLKWLKNQNNTETSTLDGNFQKRWQFILQFEDISPEGNANLSKILHQIYNSQFEISDEDLIDIF